MRARAPAGRTASAARSMSPVRARARAQTRTRVVCSAMALTAAKSSGEATGKPASMMSTPRASRVRATSSFSGRFIDAPGDCSPSRRVVSKIRTRLGSGMAGDVMGFPGAAMGHARRDEDGWRSGSWRPGALAPPAANGVPLDYARDPAVSRSTSSRMVCRWRMIMEHVGGIAVGSRSVWGSCAFRAATTHGAQALAARRRGPPMERPGGQRCQSQLFSGLSGARCPFGRRSHAHRCSSTARKDNRTRSTREPRAAARTTPGPSWGDIGPCARSHRAQGRLPIPVFVLRTEKRRKALDRYRPSARAR